MAHPADARKPQDPDTVRQLLEAAEQMGGYQAISLIAGEASRRLGQQRRQSRNGMQTDLVRVLTASIETLGDVETASLLQDAIGIYQRALRQHASGDALARCWGDAWMGLGETARKLLRASLATPGEAERKNDE
jgi:hypothetical protein